MALTIDELVARARAGLDRVAVEDLDREVEQGAVVVDIRPVEQRERDGELPGALVIDRNVFEWRLAQSSDFKTVELSGDERVIVVCNQGFQSSLAAANLQELGLPNATDLEGGFEALVAYRRELPD